LNHPQGGDLPKHAQQAIQRLEYKNIDLKVSEVSAGEFARIASIDEPNDTLICNLYHRIKDKEFTICWVERSELRQFLKLVDDIRTAVDRIQPSDVLIVAQSMVDARCRGLLTFDGEMIDSVRLKDVISKNRPGFIVTDDPL
jgi:hypothetical protein